MEGENIFANHIPDKGLKPKICKEQDRFLLKAQRRAGPAEPHACSRDMPSSHDSRPTEARRAYFQHFRALQSPPPLVGASLGIQWG